MQDNQVFVNDHGIIEIRAIGDQTADSVQTMGDQARELALEQVKAGRQVLILDDLMQLGEAPADARSRFVDLVTRGGFEKFALLGSGDELRADAPLLLQETGRGSNVRYFEDRAACLEWLLKPVAE